MGETMKKTVIKKVRILDDRDHLSSFVQISREELIKNFPRRIGVSSNIGRIPFRRLSRGDSFER
jgi:hypothetical protein